MSELKTELISKEYESLRSELLQNKQFVFERPLLIITAIAVASTQLSEKQSILLLPILLIFVLLINLWFTVERMWSNARIVAYFEIFVESDQCQKWIGWEKSLRYYRIWNKTQTKEKFKEFIRTHINPAAIPDSGMFYPSIFWLHVGMVLLAMVVAVLPLMEKMTLVPLVASSAAVVLGLVFIGFCCSKFRPNKMKDMIEVQRVIWVEVYKNIPGSEKPQNNMPDGKTKESSFFLVRFFQFLIHLMNQFIAFLEN